MNIKRDFQLIAVWFFCCLTIGLSLTGQEVNNIRKSLKIPDIDGFQTLKCDLHIHTAFSDGTVWPGERVNEAWSDGLDAIAITDHIEYTPHSEYLKADHNASFVLARETALCQNILLIQGTEITKKFPGHFNALFIKDANLIANENYKLSIEKAIEQGAYVVLNHPREAIPNGAEWWTKELAELFDKGYLHGIEIFNWNDYYPKALDFALDNKLTIFASTDIHNGKALYLNQLKMRQRPMTLVFAKERSVEGIKEALLSRRAVVLFKDTLYGQEELLRKLFLNSIEISKIHYRDDFGNAFVNISNISDIPFTLSILNEMGKTEFFAIGGQETVLLKLSLIDSVKSLSQEYIVENIFVRSNQNLKIQLTFE
jgi:predicted metal-dependent phosphoesterase TrpH